MHKNDTLHDIKSVSTRSWSLYLQFTMLMMCPSNQRVDMPVVNWCGDALNKALGKNEVRCRTRMSDEDGP